MLKTRYFITIEWCNNGFRGVFCRKDGVTAAKDDEPHTTEWETVKESTREVSEHGD